MTLMIQEGDVKLFQILNDGDMVIENGVAEMNGGLATAAYLSIFGGNEDDNGRPRDVKSWWGNFIEDDPSARYISETQHLMQALPLITGNLIRIEDAVSRDLEWFLTEKIASSITVEATIPGVNKVDINVRIVAEGIESTFSFTENWKLDLRLQPLTKPIKVLSTEIFSILQEDDFIILTEDGRPLQQEVKLINE